MLSAALWCVEAEAGGRLGLEAGVADGVAAGLARAVGCRRRGRCRARSTSASSASTCSRMEKSFSRSKVSDATSAACWARCDSSLVESSPLSSCRCSASNPACSRGQPFLLGDEVLAGVVGVHARGSVRGCHDARCGDQEACSSPVAVRGSGATASPSSRRTGPRSPCSIARPRRARSIAEEVGGIAVVADVADPDAVTAAVDEAAERLGGLDVVVSNAGIGNYKPLVDYTDQEWRKLIDVNLSGAFYVAAGGGAAPATSGRWRGRARRQPQRPTAPSPGEGPYSAAKAGVVNLTMTAALELAPADPGQLRVARRDRHAAHRASSPGARPSWRP